MLNCLSVCVCASDNETGSQVAWDSALFEFHTFYLNAQSCNEETMRNKKKKKKKKTKFE